MAMQLQKAVLDAGIVTRDLGRAARFYGEVLGLPAAGEIVMPGIGLVRRYAVGESTLRIFLPETLPRNANGKIMKNELRDRFKPRS